MVMSSVSLLLFNIFNVSLSSQKWIRQYPCFKWQLIIIPHVALFDLTSYLVLIMVIDTPNTPTQNKN